MENGDIKADFLFKVYENSLNLMNYDESFREQVIVKIFELLHKESGDLSPLRKLELFSHYIKFFIDRPIIDSVVFQQFFDNNIRENINEISQL